MEYQLSEYDLDLCMALSDLFVDNDYSYKYVAGNLYKYPIDKTEVVFFEWISPLYYGYYLTPVPPEWWGFSKEDVRRDVVEYLSKEGYVFNFKKRTCIFFMRIFFKNEWKLLKKEIILKKTPLTKIVRSYKWL